MNKPYIVPRMIEDIVRRMEPDALTLLARGSAGGCPLKGSYTVDVPVALDEATHLIAVLEGASSPRTELHVEGCLALRQRVCYLERGSKKQPQVSCKEACPVYQRVVQLLRRGDHAEAGW